MLPISPHNVVYFPFLFIILFLQCYGCDNKNKAIAHKILPREGEEPHYSALSSCEQPQGIYPFGLVGMVACLLVLGNENKTQSRKVCVEHNLPLETN